MSWTGPDEDASEQDPEDSGPPAEEQAGQDRPDDRARGGDRAEVLGQQPEGRGRDVVGAVLEDPRGNRVRVVESEAARQQASVDEIAAANRTTVVAPSQTSGMGGE
jgi:hypothetical protein